MVGLEEAKMIAAGRLREIGGCTEYTNAYVFFSANTEESTGGPDSPVAVLKENGACCGMPEYILRYGCKEKIREIRF